MALNRVSVGVKSLDDYRKVVGDKAIDELKELAAPLRGARVLHLSATAYGGGVAELLSTLVPLMHDLGLDVRWDIIHGSDEFFATTKFIHNGLQGMDVPWTDHMMRTFVDQNKYNASLLDETFDYCVVHDPQPLAMLHFLRDSGRPRQGKWIWRCHIDPSQAQPELWSFLLPFVLDYDATIFTLEEYARDPKLPKVTIIHPCIDPLSPKNIYLDAQTTQGIVEGFGVNSKRPTVVQISRFDPWKDPLGVIEAYRLVKAQVPDVQLVMGGSMAHDDPEGWYYYEKTVRAAGEDYDIHIFTNMQGLGNAEVNAFQRAASVVIQKSIREGFGLTAAEAMWKERPVVVGNVGGLRLQVEDGRSGYLVNSPEECAARVVELLSEPRKAAEMGRRAKDRVTNNFLITHLLRNYLRLLNSF